MLTSDSTKLQALTELCACNNTWEEQTMTQCKVYLFQSMGHDLGFPFAWKRDAPFSRVLMDYMADWQDVIDGIVPAEGSLDDEASGAARAVADLTFAQPTGIREDQWYRILAEVVRWALEDSSRKDLQDRLDNACGGMPACTANGYLSALDALDEIGCIPAEEQNSTAESA